MDLFVANASQQNHIFYFRLPESDKRHQLPIPMLSQIVIQKLSREAIDMIIEDHEVYGFVEASQATHSRKADRMASLCYSVDKPVPPARIDALLRGNHEILDANGRAMRQQAAIASNDRLVAEVSKQSHLSGMPVTDIGNVEVTIQQDVKGDDNLSSKEAIGEGLVINRHAKHGSKTQSSRSRSGAQPN